ncbi:hermansky-Pudlak syndrome 5 protein homolog [Elysia marginata]|uniref:Hermansky-Pudlak syndrome 5 protein homolog n=1 Tax=Elysia marginata TaxID=1093978 RepID=A0AAV4GTZ5_9GAST|nr:hermansky-Pudlak syndrome 5 protein homolog [Elysia marginata]
MTWDSTSSRLYVGDDTGKISVISVPSSKTKTLFSAPSQVIALLDSSVYQIQWWKEKLLVSTVTHSHLFDTVKHTYSTIGTKPRAGEFGSCFFLEPNSQVPVIYCARPGSRMWEVSFEGKVLNTHQFKQLMGVPAVPVVRSRSETFDFTNEIPYQGLSTNFLKMFSMGHFIITWSSKGLYMFDPINVKLVMWTQSIKSIKDVCVYRNDIYLFLENTTVRRLTVLPIYQLFTVLASRQRWSLLAQMLLAADTVNFRPAALKRVKRDLLLNIYQGLKESGQGQLLERVRASMEDVSEGSIDSLGPDSTEDFLDSLELKGYIFLSSGMVVREGLGTDLSREVTTFERYVPSPQGQLQRSASDVSFSQENAAGEGEKDGNEDEKLSSGEKTEQDQGQTAQQLSNTVETTLPSAERQDGNFCLAVDKEGQHSKDQAQVSVSLSDADFDESANKSDSTSTTDFISLKGEATVEYSHMDDEQKDDINLQVEDKRSGFNLPSCQETVNLLSESSELSSGQSDKEDYFAHRDHADAIPSDPKLAKPAIDSRKIKQNEDTMGNHFEVNISSSNEITASVNSTLLCSSNIPVCSNSTSHSNNFSLEIHSLSESVTVKESTTGPIQHSLNGPNEKDHLNIKDDLSDSKPVGDENQSVPTADRHENQSVPTADRRENHSVPTSNRVDASSPSSPSPLAQAHQILSAFPVPHQPSGPASSKPTHTTSGVGKLTGNSSSETTVIGQHLNNTEKSTPSGGDGGLVTSKPLPVEPLKERGNSLDDTQHTAWQNKNLARFASVPASTANDEIIARPHRHSKKKSRSKKPSHDALRGKWGRSASVGTETEAFHKREPELDAMSVSTISSVEEEEELASKSYPDLRSANGDTQDTTEGQKVHSAALSLEDRRHSEIIPSLFDRLAAARSLEDSDEYLRSNSLTSSGEHTLVGATPLGSLSVLKDGLSLKLKNQTKSFIKSLKETNILMKSASASKLDGLSDHQRPQSSLSISPPPYAENLSPPPLSPGSVGREGGENGDDLITLDTVPLYTLALDIKRKLLSSPTMLLDPRQSQTLLASWAREIVVAVGKVSLELQARKREAEQRSQTADRLQATSPLLVEAETFPHRPKSQTDLRDLVFRGSKTKPTTSGNDTNSLPNSLNASTSPDLSTFSTSYPSMKSDTDSPDSTEPTSRVQSGEMGWWSVINANSPIEIPAKHLELFQWLTTRCWMCGMTGDVMSALHQLSTNNSQKDVSTAASNSQDKSQATFETHDTAQKSADTSSHDDIGMFSSEESVVSMIRTLLPPDLFTSFMKQKGKTTIPSLLSLLSDALTPSNHSNNNSESAGVNSINNQCSTSISASNVSENPESVHKHFDGNGSDINRNSRIYKGSGGKTEELMQTVSEREDVISQDSGSGSDTYTTSNTCSGSDFNEGKDLANSSELGENKHFLSSHDDTASVSQHLTPSKSSPGQGVTSSAVLRQDADLALFTRLLFFLLDYDQVRSAWEERRTREKPLLLTWVSLVSCSQEKGLGDIVSSIFADRHTKSAVDYLRSGILPHKSAMIGHLLELFKQAPLMASDFCGELSKVISPVDLLSICALTACPALLHLVRYFKQAMLDSAAFFSSASAAELVNVLPGNWMESILVRIKSDEERENIIWLCSQFQYYRLCVRLLAQAGQWRRLLLWIVELDDIRLLKSRDCFPGITACVFACSPQSLTCLSLHLEICFTTYFPLVCRYYRLCVRLLAQADQWRRLLHWIVELDDIRLLKSRNCFPEAYLPRDIREWTFLLTCMREKLRSSGSSKHNPGPDGEIALEEQISASILATMETLAEAQTATRTAPNKVVEDRVKSNFISALDSKEGVRPFSICVEDFGEGNTTAQEDNNNSPLCGDQLLSQRNMAEIKPGTGIDFEDLDMESSNFSSSETRRDGSEDTSQFMVKRKEVCSQDTTSSIKKNLSLTFRNDNHIQENRNQSENRWSLTWGNVGYLLLEHLGGAAAINLLVSHMTEKGDDPSQAWSGLGSEFVQACYTSFLLEGQKDQVSHELLERMSVFMWAKKPGFLSPSVHHAFKAEQNLVERKQGRETDVQRVFGHVKSLSNKSLKSEYLGGHWGVSTDLSR